MEDNLPRVRGDAASLLAKEDLGSYSQHELLARIMQLETEIIRVKGQHDRAERQRAAADLLFKPRNSN